MSDKRLLNHEELKKEKLHKPIINVNVEHKKAAILGEPFGRADNKVE